MAVSDVSGITLEIHFKPPFQKYSESILIEIDEIDLVRW